MYNLDPKDKTRQNNRIQYLIFDKDKQSPRIFDEGIQIAHPTRHIEQKKITCQKLKQNANKVKKEKNLGKLSPNK